MIDDQHRNTNMNDKDHLVGQLTIEKAAAASHPPPQHNLLFFTFSLLSKIKNFVNKHREQYASAAKEKQLKLFQGLQSSVYSQFKVISLIAWIF